MMHDSNESIDEFNKNQTRLSLLLEITQLITKNVVHGYHMVTITLTVP
jgi:hypothetical protein